ncbi:unnamed protein product [Chrysodeixis includens]|uniref:Uncharacterized protein n=1 Tax=Chrysodeixis includens TaxID=689277 RepID=A0A9P0BXE4_CHRIL|nr:unnamed protein product [Chrysodeixis includens]
MLRACVLLVSVCVAGAGISGRGIFCRDPDTGKLHAVNTTWASSTFCGNYHCKLRRKNITGTEYPPIRHINITNIKLPNNNVRKEISRNETNPVKKQIMQSVANKLKKSEPDILSEMQIRDLLPIERNKGHKFDEPIDDLNDTEADRYLTEKEIKSISEILHTVKKSDLDAIVEIYNLAQDIYKEIDKTSTDQVLEEAFYTSKAIQNDKSQPEVRTLKKTDHVSYWYEPLNNGKVRPADPLKTDLQRSDVAPVPGDGVPILPAVIMADMEVQSSNVVLVASTQPTVPKIPTPVIPMVITPAPPPRIRQMTDTYFNGPLSNKDFGKLPYYYPMSNFQKLASYVHPPPAKMVIPILPLPKPTFKPVTYRPQFYIGGKYQKEIKPSVLLPYPFSYIRHYNWSNPQNIFHSRHQAENFEARRRANQNQNYITKLNNAILMNPDLENFQDLAVKLTRKEQNMPINSVIKNINEEKRRKRPEWQTDPLPKRVIEEVRAQVDDTQRMLKPFPFRKRVKLERVGKVIKMDEHALNRSKRSIDEKSKEPGNVRLDPEIYELYLERTTCNSDYTVPGYFRYGNLSEPFPNCCPQRIAGHV